MWKLTEYCIMPYKLNYQWIISALLSLLIESFAFVYYNGPHKFMIVLQMGQKSISNHYVGYVLLQPINLKCVTVEQPTAL